MQPIIHWHRAFKIEITRFEDKFAFEIWIPFKEMFDASPAVYDTEKNCLEDAKYVIDKYHDTK